MIDPQWEKKFNLATINIETIMLALQEKWSQNASSANVQGQDKKASLNQDSVEENKTPATN